MGVSRSLAERLATRLGPLGDGPFTRLDRLLSTVTPNPKRKRIDLALGEPRGTFPAFVARVVEERMAEWGRYPALRGSVEFREAVVAYLRRRYRLPAGLLHAERNVVGLSGSREGLFLIAQVVVPPLHAVTTPPVVLLPNPYYVAYAGAAVGTNAEPVFVSATPNTGNLPDYASLPADVLARTALCYLCTPSNPQGSVAGAAYLEQLLRLARAHGFVLAVDECYGEIYSGQAPVGALEVAAPTGSLDNLVVFHSLSKRSSVPGLRSGFVAGDEKIISAFVRFRAYAAPTVPGPILAASAALWADDEHVAETRAAYNDKFDVAERVLGNRFGFRRPPGTFFLWLDVGNGEDAARRLWAEAALRVMPGAYLSHGEGAANPGHAHVRVALVDDLATTTDAVERIVATLGAPDARAILH
ncbi:MAG: aminotransferase class I/II-fold pyridoxal phosphate-dependent enzyme [Alphaproteobacteria bacterium]|nr:aminotransferase class I/II-fold pyridoxal phosphate-dependent enzyme [Alphaproteobacteria bacterium]